MKNLLLAVAIFLLAAAGWLLLMSFSLPARLTRTGLAATLVQAILIALLSLGVIAALRRLGSRARLGLRFGAILPLGLGLRALIRMLRAPHFEGYVPVIGLALLLEAALMPAVSAFPPGDSARVSRLTDAGDTGHRGGRANQEGLGPGPQRH